MKEKSDLSGKKNEQLNLFKKLKTSHKKSSFTESSIQWYLEEINKIPLLSREEENRLARQTIAGDEKAKEKLVTANLRFVVRVAKRYQKYGVSLLDLINEGNMGLIHAASKFDPDLGYHFISYAVWWVRQHITYAVNQKASMVRIPMSHSNDLNRIDKMQREMEKKVGREPTIDEIADYLDVSPQKVENLKKLSYDYISIDEPSSQDSEYSRKDQLEDDKYEGPEDSAMQHALQDSLHKIMEELNTDEKNIVKYRFGLNGKKRLSLAKVGEKFNLSKERVRQIEKKALQKLKEYAKEEHIDDFL